MKHVINESKDHKFEYSTVLIAAIVLLTAICLELGLSKFIPSSLTTKTDDLDSMMNTLFTVLSSVSVLGITLISIIAQISSETAYGVSISSFIMQLNPKILKHNRCLFTQMTIVFFAYISLSLALYHLLFSLFLTSILITIFMSYNLFLVFNGPDFTRQKVREYFINYFRSKNSNYKSQAEQLISNLQNETTSALQKSDLNIYRDNLSLLEQLFNSDSYSNDVFEILESKTSGIFIESFKTHNAESILLTINSIVNIYNSNYQRETPKPLTVWENCSTDYYSAIPLLSVYQLIRSQIISVLYWLLLNNVRFVLEDSEQRRISGDGLSSYMGAIYLKLFRNSSLGWSNEDIIKIKKRLFKEADFVYSNSIKKLSKDHQKIARANFVNLLISFVYNRDEEVFTKTVLIDMSQYVVPEQHIKNAYFSLSIFLYYLAFIEQIEEAVQLRDFARSFFVNHFSAFRAFLGSIDNIENMSRDQIELFAEELRGYEIFPEDGGKRIVMEDAVDEFLLLIFLINSYSYDSLHGFMEKLISGREFSFCTEFLGTSKQKTADTLRRFYELCLGYKVIDNEDENANDAREVTTGMINTKIDQLEAVILNIYQKQEMSNIAKRAKPASFFTKSKDELEELCRKIAIETCAAFSASIENAQMQRQKYTIMQLNTFVDWIGDIDNSQFISDFYRTNLVGLIIYVIREHLKIQTLNTIEREKLTAFFELINQIGIDVDTLIGYRDWYWGDSKLDEFHVFEATKTKVKATNLSNILVAVQKGLLYFNVTDISVVIEMPSMNEILKPLKKNSDGLYLYNITNDIYLPFTESELEQYIGNRDRVIRIFADIEYGFGADIIGAGIEITTNRKSDRV